MKSKLLYKIIAPVVIIIIGIVMFFTLGFNKSIDLIGYHTIEVNMGSYTYQESYEKVNDVLKDKNISVQAVNTANNDYGKVITYKFTTNIEDTRELEETLKEELYQAFNYDESSILEKSFVKVSGKIQGGYNMLASLIEVGLAIIIGLVAVFIYLALRSTLANAMSLVLSVILDVLVMASLVMIVRLPINAHFGLALTGTAIFSTIFNALYYSKLTTISKEEKYLKSSNEDLIDIASSQFRTTLLVLVIAAIVCVATFAFFNLSTTIALALGVISTLYTSQMLVPYLWAIAYKRKFRKKKEVKEETEIKE